MNHKLYERNLGEHLSKLIYAAFDDIAVDWNGSIKYTEETHQNYKNLCLGKKMRKSKLKSRFTISPEVKQMLRILYNKIIEETENVDLNDIDTVEIIVAKLSAANADCYFQFMFKLGDDAKSAESNLTNASDPQKWLHSHTIGFLQKYAKMPCIIDRLLTVFDNFLKVIALKIGKLIWYYEVPITKYFFMGILSACGMDQLLLDELYNGVDTPPAKQRLPGIVRSKVTTSVEVDSDPIETDIIEIATDL